MFAPAMASVRLEDIGMFAKIVVTYILCSDDSDVLLANPFRITHLAQLSSVLHWNQQQEVSIEN